MLYEIREVFSDRIPTDEDIQKIIYSGLIQQGYTVRLWWHYYGDYKIYIKPGMTLEDCKAKLPKVYPV